MLLHTGFTLSSARCARRCAVLQVASQVVLERGRGTHAAILTGEKPGWLAAADAMLEEVYAKTPFTLKIIKGTLGVFRDIFETHPLEKTPSSPGDLRALRARELIMEEYIEKVDSVENTDISELAGRDLLSRFYGRIFCADTMQPIKRIALTILIEIKTKIRSTLLVYSRDSTLLTEAINMRKQADAIKRYIDTLKSLVPVATPAFGTFVDVPIPAGISPDLQRCFSLDVQLDELSITHE